MFAVSVLLIVFYPVVPLAAYINLLWKQPKDLMNWKDKADMKKNWKKKAEFREAEYRAMIAHSIACGIESPIQFILQVNKAHCDLLNRMDKHASHQVWLILNGKIPKPWHAYGQITLIDWYGNELALPTTAVISLAFSILSMMKALIEFNIIRVHIQVSGNHGNKAL